MPRKLNAPWTDDQDQTIRDMAATDKSPNLIAAKIGRSVHSIRTRAVRLGLKLETLTERRQRMGLLSEKTLAKTPDKRAEDRAKQ